MEYYFTPKQYISQSSLTVVDDEAKHLARVLRKKQGEEIFVTDGEGGLYKAKISAVNKSAIECSITESLKDINEPALKLSLYQSLIKNPDRFEFVVEKSVELGINALYPVVSENVVNKTTNKAERWQAIALSAMKQSQRCRLPKVSEPVSFKEAAAGCTSTLKLIAHEKASENAVTAAEVKNIHGDAALFIGPEGGFTEEEIGFAAENGFKILNLGARKYRSETAAILAAGLMLVS